MTSATRTEAVGVEAYIKGGGMGKGEGIGRRNGWDERIRGGRVVGLSREVEIRKGKGRWGGGNEREGKEVKEVRSVISQRLSLQHNPEGLHPLPINSRHVKMWSLIL